MNRTIRNLIFVLFFIIVIQVFSPFYHVFENASFANGSAVTSVGGHSGTFTEQQIRNAKMLTSIVVACLFVTMVINQSIVFVPIVIIIVFALDYMKFSLFLPIILSTFFSFIYKYYLLKSNKKITASEKSDINVSISVFWILFNLIFGAYGYIFRDMPLFSK